MKKRFIYKFTCKSWRFNFKNITHPETNIHLGWNLFRRYFGNKLQMLQKTSNPTYHSSSLLPCNMHKLINKSDFNIINLHWFQGEKHLSINLY